MIEQEKKVTDIDWRLIIETIESEKCILFIGPEIFKDGNGRSITNQMTSFLNVGNNKDIQNFYEEDGMFLFSNGAKKTKSYYKIREFYNQDFLHSEEILKKLAKIPFHFIVSISPDKKCHEAFDSLGLKSKFSFYWKNQKADDSITKPTMSNPVIYNIFGSIDRQDSMILTYDDLFDYFESIFKENSMPAKLKLNLKEAHNFIFLGLDFDRWYMQLLLRILYLHNDKYEFMRYAANQKVSERLKTFCYQQFKIEFIPTQISEFVDELYNECEKIGILREPHKKQHLLSRQLTDWLALDRIDDILKAIKEFLENIDPTETELMDDMLLLSSRFSRLKRRINLGLIDTKEEEITSSKIRFALMELIKEIKNLE